MIVAGIDLGSNATRIVLVKASAAGIDDPQNIILKKRYALRLGTDVFQTGRISTEKKEQLLLIFKEIRDMFFEYKVGDYSIKATSALRDASNGEAISHQIAVDYKLKIDIIDGKEEARLLRQSLERRSVIPKDKNTLLMDVGGGSLELSILQKGELCFAKSLQVGTLRLIEDVRSGQLIKNYGDILDQIDEAFVDAPKVTGAAVCFGTGGNFRRVGRLRKLILNKTRENSIRKEDFPVLIGKLFNTSIGKFPGVLQVKEEHACVIIPALLICQRTLNFWPSMDIKVPQVSLNHGIIDEILMRNGKLNF